ncbi:MAG TPA: PQQ-binding-like beta-propeller repeat protein [Bryobacteraceae bacterium]|jgi:polyvinyl alcohol dehydrogenase (cytochrome)|nr:PQQ-binding-like beta-propeller repeat protein [Bryobacteraceae bacterium]
MLSRRILIALFASSACFAAAPDGAALYKSRCAVCHDGKPQLHMPSHDDLVAKTPEAVVKAMFEGSMQPQAAGLSEEEGRAIAKFITAKEFSTSTAPMAGQCTAPAKPLAIASTDWNGWGQDLGNSRYQPKPGLSAADVPKLKVKWAFGFPSDTSVQGQPTVVGGRIFVGSVSGTLYSLDAATGCIYWTYKTGATIRTAPVIGKVGKHFIAFIGDVKATAHAVDAETGKPLWKVKIEDHPVARIVGAPTFYNGRLYVPVSSIEEASAMGPKYECCKFRGSVAALDAETGKVIWKSFTVLDPPKAYKTSSTGAQLYGPAGAAVWSSPTVDPKRKLVYAATGDSYTDVDMNTSDAILAFDLKTGKLVWSKQVLEKDNFTMACGQAGKANCPETKGPDFDFGTSPALRSIGGGKQLLVIGQKSGILWALDPDDKGKVVWQARVGKGGALGGIEWGHATDDTQAYAAISDRGKGPGLVAAVNLKSGEIAWSKLTPDTGCKPGTAGCQTTMSAAISVIPGVVFAGGVDGHFRAYDTKSGEIVWDFDAAHPYDTVNSVPAKGGSFDAPGPVIVNGTVYTTSGYGMWGGSAGNVLLAFSIDGK